MEGGGSVAVMGKERKEKKKRRVRKIMSFMRIPILISVSSIHRSLTKEYTTVFYFIHQISYREIHTHTHTYKKKGVTILNQRRIWLFQLFIPFPESLQVFVRGGSEVIIVIVVVVGV